MLLPAAVVLRLLASRAPGLVERGYSEGLYRAVGVVLARATGFFAFSLAEWVTGLFLVVVLSWCAALSLRVLRDRKHRRRAVLTALGTLFAAGGIVYATFVALWGLN